MYVASAIVSCLFGARIWSAVPQPTTQNSYRSSAAIVGTDQPSGGVSPPDSPLTRTDQSSEEVAYPDSPLVGTDQSSQRVATPDSSVIGTDQTQGRFGSLPVAWRSAHRLINPGAADEIPGGYTIRRPADLPGAVLVTLTEESRVTDIQLYFSLDATSGVSIERGRELVSAELPSDARRVKPLTADGSGCVLSDLYHSKELDQVLGAVLIRVDPTTKMTMELGEEVRGFADGSVHGGMLATFADVTSAVALWRSFDRDTEIPTTTDMHMRYYRQPTAGPLTAEATLVHAGRSC